MVLSARARRIAVGIFGCFYSVAVPIAALADARADAESLRSGSTSHIEQNAGSDCPQVHPATCGICQQVSSTQLPASAQHVVIGEETGFALVGGPSHDGAEPLWYATPPQRGPPVT